MTDIQYKIKLILKKLKILAINYNNTAKKYVPKQGTNRRRMVGYLTKKDEEGESHQRSLEPEDTLATEALLPGKTRSS